MTQAEAIEKIKKLLRMKRGGTPGEIQNALAAAAKLAREHGIDLGTVNPEEEASRLTHVEEVLKSRLPAEARYAAAILVNHFSVEVCVIRGGRFREGVWTYQVNHRVVLVGTAWDCEVARYVFVFLQRQFRLAWNQRVNKRLKNRPAFLDGMFRGLMFKLSQDQPQGEGLVLAATARRDYLAKLIPGAEDKDLPRPDDDADAARWAGMVAGKNTNIRSGLSDAAAPQRPAIGNSF